MPNSQYRIKVGKSYTYVNNNFVTWQSIRKYTAVQGFLFAMISVRCGLVSNKIFFIYNFFASFLNNSVFMLL